MTFNRFNGPNDGGRNLDGTGHDFTPPGKPKPGGNGGVGNNKGTLGGSPGLVTSTGGIFGASGALLVPFFDTVNNKYYFKFYDATDFDDDNDSEYDFRQEDVQDDRYINIHRVSVTYREIGKVRFIVGVQVYIDTTDTYIFKEIEVVISNSTKRKDFPDNKLHTRKISLKITGIRPQLYILRKGSRGPMAITKARMIGNADEKAET